MEKVTEKEIVGRINKEFDMMNKSEVQIDWNRELTFALFLIVKFGRILNKSYEEMLETFIGNKVRDYQKQLNLTDDEVKEKYERMKNLENRYVKGMIIQEGKKDEKIFNKSEKST